MNNLSLYQEGNWIINKAENQYYIYIAKEGEYFLVDPILTARVLTHQDLLHPIPIDRNKISVCGFRQDGDIYFHVIQEPGPVCLRFVSPDSIQLYFQGKESPELIHIHELQNAYHLLTGKKLPVNLAGI